MFFNDADEDSDMPMQIVTLVELSTCQVVCGGSASHDTCIAVAGLAANNSIVVKKYCVPKAVGYSVRSAPGETWTVWGSDKWTESAMDIQFADTILGDTLIVLRDGIGSVDMGPQQQFVTVHPRSIQVDAVQWDRYYSTEELRLPRLTFASANDYVDGRGVDNNGKRHITLAIIDMFVFPQQVDSQRVYIVLSTINDMGVQSEMTETHRGAVCGVLDVKMMVDTRNVVPATLQECSDMEDFFTLGVDSGYVPVVFSPTLEVSSVVVAQVPTMQGTPLKLMTFSFNGNIVQCSRADTKTIMPENTVIQNTFPAFQQFSTFGKQSLLKIRQLVPDHVTMTSEGIMTKIKPRMSQNTRNVLDLTETSRGMEYFMSGDPNTPAYWLVMVRVSLNDQSFVASKSSSQLVDVKLTVYQTCDRRSCMGCVNPRLMAMCYSMHQCMVVNCIGTTVNQMRPLCNLGLVLQSNSNEMISLALGAWLAFAESYATILRLSLTGTKKVSVEYVDDAFFGFVCSAKDYGGQISALLTSAIGAGLISRSRMIDPNNEKSSLVDTRVSARTTIILNGVNSFLFQLTLYPLYMLIVAKKVASCTIKDVASLVSATGFEVTIGNPAFDNASDLVAGSCMTSFMEEEAASGTAGGGTVDAAFSAVGDLASGLLLQSDEASAWIAKKLNKFGSRASLGPALHMVDAHLAFASGVVSGMQDMAQTIDEAHCKFPDFYMYKVLTCACGDTAVRIRSVRASATETSHWCTGSLKMMDGFGKITYTNNPYSLDTLRTKMGDVQEYLRCISQLAEGQKTSVQDCSSLKPFVDGIDNDPTVDVVSIAVLSRCLANFQQQRWDDGAYKQYEDGYANGNRRLPGSVGDCLVTANDNGLSNTGCLQDYLMSVGISKSLYFGYEKNTAVVHTIDACIVFTGPAGHSNTNIQRLFQPCVDTHVYKDITDNTACLDVGHDAVVDMCQIPPMIWSGGSKNNVPVATYHFVAETVSQNKKVLARKYFNEAKTKALCALGALEDYVNNELDVVLFSAEGDSLHQMFDCMVQGPYARMDLWGRGPGKKLSVPYWARDDGGIGASRTLDLPCGNLKLGGDMRPPFTCGGSTRKAIIKYFVRDHINKNAEGVSLVVQLVRKQIAKLKKAWNTDIEEFACLGINGFPNLDSCSATSPDKYTPPVLKVSFDAISGDDIIKDLTAEIWPFLQEALAGGNQNQEFTYHHLDPVEMESWNWVDSGMGSIAKHLGFYDSQRPVVNYSAEEVGYPFKNNTSIWDMCTGMVSQVMFTMPMATIVVDDHDSWTIASVLGLRNPTLEFDPTLESDFDGQESHGLSMLEKYVNKLLESSFSNSPMFWHYAMRHVPSNSLVCHSEKSLAKSERLLKFDSTEFDEEDLPVIPPIPLYGYDAFTLGGVDKQCFCGWELNSQNECIIPSAICIDTAQSPELGCKYAHGSDALRVFTTWLVENWNASGSWQCPENDLSDSWGVIPSDQVDQWIQGDNSLQLRVAHLLAIGMGGLRVGNAKTLAKQARKEGVHPGTRVDDLRSKSGAGSISLKNCERHILDSFDATSVVNELVDDLFPVAQGIHDSHVVSACLRFATEYLRLRAMSMISDNNLQNMQDHMDKQGPVVESWKTKCEVQLDMLGVCRSNALFEYVPDEQHVYDCPFTISDAYKAKNYYVTPGCLVWTNVINSETGGNFYDPCRLGDCSEVNRVFSLEYITTDVGLKVPFDVRDMGSNEPLGTWPIVFLSQNDTSNAEHEELALLLEQWRVDGRNGTVPWRLQTKFVDDVVSMGGAKTRGGLGNTPPQKSWGTSEGFANISTQFCDAISDWWPEDWSKPVGYHVTLPCDGEDAAYRTFDSAFFMETDTTNGVFQVTMKYTHTMLRNMTSASNEYGRSGFCRRGQYGMSTHQTNTMRVCTRDAVNVMYDAHVPVMPKWENGEGEQGDEYCADSPYDVPWSIDEAGSDHTHPGMFSVGHVAHYAAQDYGSLRYQVFPTASAMSYVHPGVRNSEWGASCTDGNSLVCIDDTDCVGVDTSVTLVCVRGVCVLSYDYGITCYSHSDCAIYDKMCSGEGICEEAVWQVENRLPLDTHGENAVEFDLFAEHCGSNNNDAVTYDMWGGSKWGTIPDILPMYGMCSYRNWYEYREFSEPQSPRKSLGCIDRSCMSGTFHADRQLWWDTDADYSKIQFDSLLMSNKYRVVPHQCDRDYEHLENMHGCAPDTPKVFGIASGKNTGRAFRELKSTFAQTIDRNNNIDVLIRGDNPFFEDATAGFLSVKVLDGSQTIDSKTFQMCSTVPQCAKQIFKFNNIAESRMVFDLSVIRSWSFDNDAEKCGSFGVFVGLNSQHCSMYGGDGMNCCKIDEAVAIHYHVACNTASAARLTTANGGVLVNTLRNLCNELHYTRPHHVYVTSDSSPDSRDTVLLEMSEKLNRIWDLFVKVGTHDSSQSNAYVLKTTFSDVFVKLVGETTQCDRVNNAAFCTGYHQSNTVKLGGYYFARYGMYEFPIAWWHVCMMLPGNNFGDKLRTGETIQCSAWNQRKPFDSMVYNNNVLSELQKLNGGITSDMLASSLASLRNRVTNSINTYMQATTQTGQPTCFSKTTYRPLVGKSGVEKLICAMAILDYTWKYRGATSRFKDIPEDCWQVDESVPRQVDDRYFRVLMSDLKEWMIRMISVEGNGLQPSDFILRPGSNTVYVGFMTFQYIPPRFDMVFPSVTESVYGSSFPETQDVCVKYDDVTSTREGVAFFECPFTTCELCLQKQHCDVVQQALVEIATRIDAKQDEKQYFSQKIGEYSEIDGQKPYTSFAFDYASVLTAINLKHGECLDAVVTKKFQCIPDRSDSPCNGEVPPKQYDLVRAMIGDRTLIRVDANEITGRDIKYSYPRGRKNVVKTEKVIICTKDEDYCYGEDYTEAYDKILSGTGSQPWVFANSVVQDANFWTRGGPAYWLNRGRYFTPTRKDATITTGDDVVDTALDKMASKLPLPYQFRYLSTPRRPVVQIGKVYKHWQTEDGWQTMKEAYPDWARFTVLMFETEFLGIWDFYTLNTDMKIDGCLPSRDPLTKGQSVASQIDETDCFKMKNAVGSWKCGFQQLDVTDHTQGAATFSNRPRTDDRIRLYQDTVLGWSTTDDSRNTRITPDTIFSNNTRHMVYTMYLSMLQNMAVSTIGQGFVVPRELLIFQNHAAWIGGFDFDASSLFSFDTNVETLKEMQMCGENATTITYGVTRNSRLYENAHLHYRDKVSKDAGSILHPEEVLIWKGLSHLHSISKTLPTWSMHKRQDRQVFGSWVLQSAERSRKGSARNSVCFFNGTGRDIINPWVGGDFNPFELCDTVTDGVAASSTSIVQELISASCNEMICPRGEGDYWKMQPNKNCQNSASRPLHATVPKRVTTYQPVVGFSEQMVASQECTSRVGVCPKEGAWYDNNMCAHKPILPTVCNHPQGMLGGHSGTPVDSSLYSDSTPKYETLLETGVGLFLQGGNAIYAHKAKLGTSLHGILKQSLDDIGGHHLVLVLEQNRDDSDRPHMFVEKTPLAYERDMDLSRNDRVVLAEEQLLTMSVKSLPTGDWLADLAAVMRSEQVIADRLYPIDTKVVSHKWSCPLRRLAFWSKVVDNEIFSPLVPSPVRSARLFGNNLNMNFKTRSHPTMTFSSASDRMSDVYTSNGFCFCVDSVLKCAQTESKDCGIKQTIRSLHDHHTRPVRTIRPISTPTCVDQLDWPYERGTLRDGTVMHARNSDSKRMSENKRTCDVTDRLPPFWYRYQSNATIVPSPNTSLHKEGSCHMGTAPHTNTYSYQNGVCRKVNETRTNVTVICHVAGETEPKIIIMDKTLSKPPQWAIESMEKKRKTCNSCPPLPKWEDQGGDALPRGAEVSYGIPFRWSASRLLAADVKFWLCGKHHNDTDACRESMNEAAWGLESFIDHFTNDAGRLFRNPANSSRPLLHDATSMPDKYDDTRMWNGPNAAWVACSQQPDGKCFGGISKAEWLSPKRGDRCVEEFTKMVEEGFVNESTVPLDICTLSSDLSNLCDKLKEALNLVVTGNCIAAEGDTCQPSEWVYTPSMYSMSNQQFVRSTVIDFYETYGAYDSSVLKKGDTVNGELVCPLDDEDQNIRWRNGNLSVSCSSKQLERLKDAIKIARRVVHYLVEAAYIQMQIIFTLFRLIMPGIGDNAQIMRELEFWFKRYLRLVLESITAMADLLFRMLTDTGGLGTVMKALVNALCLFVNTLMKFWNSVMCWILKTMIGPLLQALIGVFRPVIEFFKVADGVLSLIDNILHQITTAGCDTQFDCTTLTQTVPIQGLGVLPVTSRCWADYTPSVDDVSAYSCSASDTCTNADLSFGQTNMEFGGVADSTRQVLCDACPRIPNPDFNKYACDTYTKQCSCNRPKTTTTSCTTNAECQMQGSTTQCALVNDFTTGRSYGTLECQTCPTQAVCLITDGAKQIGRCSCLQQGMRLQSCQASEMLTTLLTDASALCAVTSAANSARSMTSFFTWKSLAVAPCAITNKANTQCYRTDVMGFVVVAHGTVDTSFLGRRLLEQTEDDKVWLLAAEILSFESWNHTSDPCRMLANAYTNGEHLSITEESHLKTCVKARQLGNSTINALNLTTMYEHDNFLMSFFDFLDVASR
jgi:hypothetical protein